MPNPVKSSSSPRPTQAVALDLCKAFDRGWYAGLLFIKIIKLLEDLGVVICGICKTVKKKEQISGLLGMLLGTLGACIIGNMLVQ